MRVRNAAHDSVQAFWLLKKRIRYYGAVLIGRVEAESADRAAYRIARFDNCGYLAGLISRGSADHSVIVYDVLPHEIRGGWPSECAERGQVGTNREVGG